MGSRDQVEQKPPVPVYKPIIQLVIPFLQAGLNEQPFVTASSVYFLLQTPVWLIFCLVCCYQQGRLDHQTFIQVTNNLNITLPNGIV